MPRHRRAWVVVVIGAIVVAAGGACQPTMPTMPATTTTATPIPALYALKLAPRTPSAGPAPVLIMLHGLGSNEADLATLVAALDPRFAVFSLRAPIVVSDDAFSWFHVRFTREGVEHDVAEFETARQAIVVFVRALADDPQLDIGHVSVLGFSQGAMLAIALTLTEPTLFSSVVAASGRVPAEVASAVRGRRIDHGPAVLITHGTSDATLPFALATGSRAVLEAAGVPVEFRAYDGGHTITAAMRHDISAFLTAHLPAHSPATLPVTLSVSTSTITPTQPVDAGVVTR